MMDNLSLWLLKVLLQAWAESLKSIALEMDQKHDDRASSLFGIVSRMNDALAGLDSLPLLRRAQ